MTEFDPGAWRELRHGDGEMTTAIQISGPRALTVYRRAVLMIKQGQKKIASQIQLERIRLGVGE